MDGLGGGLIGLSFWPLRKEMRIIRWGFVLTLVALHLYMKAPVWHLISRVADGRLLELAPLYADKSDHPAFPRLVASWV